MENSNQIGKIQEVLTRGVEEVFDRKSLEQKMFSGKPLRIKHGIDPTGKKIHIGRATQFLKLRDFQDLGHKIVLIIGDFTAKIGDASDKDAMRRILTTDEIAENFQDYAAQMGKILDMSKTELRYNSEWLSKLSSSDVIKICQKFTAQQMIQRRNFKERWEAAKPIGLHELLYPIFQGYDSVAVEADLELGGSDQLFNLQTGRELQAIYGQKPQDIMTLKMIWGLDGRKMSTSWGNVVNMDDSPKEMFGKIMSMRDEFILDYFETCTRLPMDEIKKMKEGLEKGSTNYREAKASLARELVKMYHGAESAREAEQEFDKVFKNKELPSDIPEIELNDQTLDILDLLVKTGSVLSKQEAKRLIMQQGVKIDDKIIQDWKEKIDIKSGMVIKIGKRRFARIK